MSAVRAEESATKILTRHGIMKAVPAVVALTISTAAAEGIALDAELLAFWPIWIVTRAAFEDALEALKVADARFADLASAPLDFHKKFDGSINEFCAEQRRLGGIQLTLEIEANGA